MAANKSNTPAKAEPNKNHNAQIDLKGFDYLNLKGEAWKKYLELVGDYFDPDEKRHVTGSLQLYQLYDFKLYRAKPVIVERYPGIKDSPKDLVGIELVSEIHLNATRLELRHANDYNQQILNAHARAGHGKFYLLAK
jgi:hypothetical protein